MYNEPIRSDDENAVEKLKAKAETLRASQEEMKKANAHFRKFGTMKGYGGITDEKAEQLDIKILTGNSWDRKPYASYMLQNNSQNLRTVEQRIKAIERESKRQDEDRSYDTEKYGFEVVENKEAQRLQLLFDKKPDEETRSQLKSCGFKWSPTNEAWQRLLNQSARYSLKYFISYLEQQQGKSGMEM